MSHGLEQLSTLIQHYGNAQEAMNPSSSRINRTDPKINKNAAMQEYQIFKEEAFSIRNKWVTDKREKLAAIGSQLKSLLRTSSNRVKRKRLLTERKQVEATQEMSLADLLSKLGEVHKRLFPSIIFLLEQAVLCPIGYEKFLLV